MKRMIPVKRNIVIAVVVSIMLMFVVFLYHNNSNSKPKPRPVLRLHGTNQGDCSGPPNVYTMVDGKWKNDRDICKHCFDFPQMNLGTRSGDITLFIYEPNEDIYISQNLQLGANHEENENDFIHHLLKEDPSLKFVDIGANIGIYSLLVAKMGRQVLSVEALNINLHHLCASVVVGNFSKTVTLVYNALSNEHSLVNLGMDKNNKGGTFVDVDADHVKYLKEGRAEGSYGQIATVTMDDLLLLPFFKDPSKVVIKMDVEGFEAKVLEKADRFFEHINVVAVQLEWEFHRGRESGEAIISFMNRHKYSPHSVATKEALDFAKKESWGYDVMWLRNS